MRARLVPLAVADEMRVRVALHDALGREVAILHDAPLSRGDHLLEVDTERLSPGVYLVRAAGEAPMEPRQITIVR